jgi:NAD(P)-dependent dehydrogenase (short-subunit alcohol dehydrogenase family)
MEWNAFKDRVVLVTGSSRGIGNAIARKFARSGADVVINYRQKGGRSENQAELLRQEIEAMGRRALLIRADVSEKQSVKQMFQEVRERFSRLDFLILNAAKAPFKPLERLFERELRELVGINFMGNIFCIQEALPLLEKGGGRVVFISSLGSRFYNPEYPLGSMKAAMESVVRDLSESLREKGVSVNGVCGGLVKTDSFKVLRQFMEELESLPEGLFVEPEALAEVVLFLCDPASRGIRGQTLVVDNGLSNTLYRLKPKKDPKSPLQTRTQEETQ